MRIAICIPVHGETKAIFTRSLARMLVYTLNSTINVDGAPVRPAIEIFTASSSILPFSRQKLLLQAIEWKADFLLWMDADHSFPPDTLLRLLAREKPVVGANFLTRTQPPRATAGRIAEGRLVPVPTTREIAQASPVEQVDSVGLGLTLMSMTVIDILRDARGGEEIGPLFDTSLSMVDGALDVRGEDAHFFGLLGAAGVPVFVDHALSLETGHVAEAVLGF